VIWKVSVSQENPISLLWDEAPRSKGEGDCVNATRLCSLCRADLAEIDTRLNQSHPRSYSLQNQTLKLGNKEAGS
jgi:hypothetical protein